MQTSIPPLAPLHPNIPASANSLSFQGLNQLSAAAKADPHNPQAIKAVAQQFEALLMQQMLTVMNATSLGPDLLGDTSGPMFKSLYTQQIAATISQGRGIGLASFLAKELATRYGTAHPGPPVKESGPTSAAYMPVAQPQTADLTSWRHAITSSPTAVTPLRGAVRPGSGVAIANVASVATQSPTSNAAPRSLLDRAQAFIQSILPSVQSAATTLKVSPIAILAQAALETGWGSHAPGHNLFGIKAGASWQGETLTSITSEVNDGVTHLGEAAFRAYQNVSDSVQNYSQMLLGSSRYQNVLGHGGDVVGFAAALQRSGYATDPHYASKLLAVAQSSTMREALAALGVQDDSSLATR